MLKVLYNSEDIRNQVIRLFTSGHGRRLAIVAFVGDGATKLIPRPACKGLEIICWPKPGGTNPDALRELRGRGARIFFADRVHMKVYWAQGRGAVITSANLSTNALGAGDLRESGVLLDARTVDVGRILRDLNAREMTDRELLRLDRAHGQWMMRNQYRGGQVGPSFKKWYGSKPRKLWKVGPWTSEGLRYSTKAKAQVKAKWGIAEPFTGLFGVAPDQFQMGDWVLEFREKDATSPTWLYVEHIVSLPKKHFNTPGEVIQAHEDKYRPVPPFRLDKAFKKAFRVAAKKYGMERLGDMKTAKVPNRLVDLIQREFH